MSSFSWYDQIDRVLIYSQPTWCINAFAYCYHSVNVISLAQFQRYHIKWCPLYLDPYSWLWTRATSIVFTSNWPCPIDESCFGLNPDPDPWHGFFHYPCLSLRFRHPYFTCETDNTSRLSCLQFVYSKETIHTCWKSIGQRPSSEANDSVGDERNDLERTFVKRRTRADANGWCFRSV